MSFQDLKATNGYVIYKFDGSIHRTLTAAYKIYYSIHCTLELSIVASAYENVIKVIG